MSFALSDDDANARYRQWRERDPFPDIAPALLTSADVIDYVAATGMIHPFREHSENGEQKLKPASYEVDLLGLTTYWDDNGRKIERVIKRGESFALHRNSIMFVQVEPYFRLPQYIALRFNLKIQHVYRGLLLGTGPLVDPGFEGPLFIPLHNLTDTDYEFRGGEGLIWMEFTKLSWPSPRLRDGREGRDPRRIGRFYSFPDRKLRRRTLNDYLSHASPHRPIRSSIPVEVTKSANAARSARRAVNVVSSVSLIAALGVGATIIALILQTMSFVRELRSDLVKRIEILEMRVPPRPGESRQSAPPEPPPPTVTRPSGSPLPQPRPPSSSSPAPPQKPEGGGMGQTSPSERSK
jgi:deoxycytidine triphosphate deaminase